MCHSPFPGRETFFISKCLEKGEGGRIKRKRDLLREISPPPPPPSNSSLELGIVRGRRGGEEAFTHSISIWNLECCLRGFCLAWTSLGHVEDEEDRRRKGVKT